MQAHLRSQGNNESGHELMGSRYICPSSDHGLIMSMSQFGLWLPSAAWPWFTVLILSIGSGIIPVTVDAGTTGMGGGGGAMASRLRSSSLLSLTSFSLVSTDQARAEASSTSRSSKLRPWNPSHVSHVISISRFSRCCLRSCSRSLAIRWWRKASWLTIFRLRSISGMLLNRAIICTASWRDGHATGWFSCGVYTTTHASTPHRMLSSRTFFISPLRRFFRVARRVASLTIHASFTLFRA
ncbi:unnamed protein product, partial [Musa acuminata var. zebrina]